MTQGYLRSNQSIGGDEGDPPRSIGKMTIKVVKVREILGEVGVQFEIDIYDVDGKLMWSPPAQELIWSSHMLARAPTLTFEFPK